MVTLVPFNQWARVRPQGSARRGHSQQPQQAWASPAPVFSAGWRTTRSVILNLQSRWERNPVCGNQPEPGDWEPGNGGPHPNQYPGLWVGRQGGWCCCCNVALLGKDRVRVDKPARIVTPGTTSLPREEAAPLRPAVKSEWMQTKLQGWQRPTPGKQKCPRLGWNWGNCVCAPLHPGLTRVPPPYPNSPLLDLRI